MYEVKIDDERVLHAIVVAAEICDAPGVYESTETYSGHASVAAIFDYVQSKVSVPIIMMDVSFDGPHIGSRIERYEDRVEIAVRSDQDDAWKRFCTIKELVHLLVDGADDCSPYGHHRIEEMLDVGLVGLASGNNASGRPTQSELLGEVAAVEIMYPARAIVLETEALERAGGEERLNVRRAALIRQMPNFYAGTALQKDFRQFITAALKSCQKRLERKAVK
ncbi:hypothetical protein [Asticcacaulis taihuensis]|uniref:hypothetical protein n=1 Tax=Asticcacaulis taihuensis TaxID=260084 RepID=UPI003F7C1645